MRIVGVNDRVMAEKKSWVEKLHTSHDLPRVVGLTGKKAEKWGEGKMVIVAPIEVDELMRRVPKGKVATTGELREALAKKHKVMTTCPLTTGIFANIAAYAAEEERLAGKKDITPYWRTLKTGGELNPKFPGGIENQKKLLVAEGHTVIQKGKRFLVIDYERSLAKT